MNETIQEEKKFLGLKLKWWLIIVAAFEIIFLIATGLITRLFFNPPSSWWWLGGFGIFFFIVDIVIGIILLIRRLSKLKVPDNLQDAKKAEFRAINELKYDLNNADNFILNKRRPINVGESGNARTHLLVLEGKGTERHNKIALVVNLDKPEDYPIMKIFDYTDEQLRNACLMSAEYPESEVVSETIQDYDTLGRPVQKIIQKQMSKAEIKKEEEKKELEDKNRI